MSDEPKDVPLLSRNTRLRPVRLSDYESLFELVSHTEATNRWRFRGATPSPEDFREMLWRGVLTQFVICRKTSETPIGLITAFDVDYTNNVVHLALLLDRTVRRTGWPLEAAIVFVNYLFEHWAFRKIYVESVEYAARWFRRAATRRLFVEEGCLSDHEWFAGRYWDVHLLALHRERWLEESGRYLKAIAPN